ncbi:MAG: L-threonylcarbamoyladenylate synthase [Candidatus Bathyarchaeota archaeon]|nr:L-threonylcarbamoyladenylate synthase [Candidatus Bathyarchaeota archaeon]
MKIVKPDEAGLKAAAKIIRDGGVAIYPTETVYGVGCAPHDAEATKRILQIKERHDKPLPLICSSTEMARKLVHMNPTAEKLAEKFWPGPLMMVLPKKMDYPVYVTFGKKTLGIRVPGNETARKLAELSGGVLVSTSANKSGQDPALTAKEAINKLGGRIDVVVDGGPSSGQVPSTVLDLSGSEMWIARSGPITGNMIMEALKV